MTQGWNRTLVSVSRLIKLLIQLKLIYRLFGSVKSLSKKFHNARQIRLFFTKCFVHQPAKFDKVLSLTEILQGNKRGSNDLISKI